MRRYNLLWLWLSVLIILLDQTLKFIIKQHFPYGSVHPVTSFLDLVHLRNYGAAFSFLDIANGQQRWLLSLVSLVVSIILLIWLLRLKKGYRWRAAALALIIGGALANFWGRISVGYVVDFLYFHIGRYYWPAFNIADSAICIGAIILIINLVKAKP